MLRLGSRKQNLSDCLDVQPGRSGIESVGRSEAMRAWSALVQSRSFNSIVIEAEPPIRGHRVVGFGASVFVSPAFALDEITRPRPGLNARIIESIACGRPVILSEAELRSANTDGDLDLVILYGSFRAGILSPDETFDGYTLMASSFVESHVGYRINQMLNEVVDETEKYHNDLTHAWRVISNFDEFWAMYPDAKWDRSRSLAVIQRDTLSVGGSMINILLHRKKPVLQLRDADQQLLIAALTGLTDDELARRLQHSLPAIKKRWLSVFERTLEKWPDLFPDWSEENGLSKRGRQKRHHLLAYVRSHPEELRPIENHPRRRGAPI